MINNDKILFFRGLIDGDLNHIRTGMTPDELFDKCIEAKSLITNEQSEKNVYVTIKNNYENKICIVFLQFNDVIVGYGKIKSIKLPEKNKEWTEYIELEELFLKNVSNPRDGISRYGISQAFDYGEGNGSPREAIKGVNQYMEWIENIIKSIDNGIGYQKITENIDLVKSEKMARVCWNINNWIFPSGSSGKSINNDTFEKINSYGYEEWLLNLDKIIDGFHYSYIQGITDAKEFTTIDVLNLFATNGNQKWYLIAVIKDVKIISKEENDFVFEEYEKNGWISEMQNQLKEVDANYESLYSADKIFNIKFKPENVNFFVREIKKPTATYYQLYNDVNIEFVDKELNNIVKEYKTEAIEVLQREGYTRTPKEAKLQYELYKILYSNFCEICEVKAELKQENNCRTDVELINKKNGNRIIFEIKQGRHVRNCIRLGVGQLLEYGYYGNSKKPIALIVVSNQASDQNDIEYIEKLNNEFKMNIFYFDIKKENEYLEVLNKLLIVK